MVCLHYILSLITVRDDDFKLIVLMSNVYIKSTAKFIRECFNIRCRNMYIMV